MHVNHWERENVVVAGNVGLRQVVLYKLETTRTRSHQLTSARCIRLSPHRKLLIIAAGPPEAHLSL